MTDSSGCVFLIQNAPDSQPSYWEVRLVTPGSTGSRTDEPLSAERIGT